MLLLSRCLIPHRADIIFSITKGRNESVGERKCSMMDYLPSECGWFCGIYILIQRRSVFKALKFKAKVKGISIFTAARCVTP